MAEPEAPLFLERRSYRRRRLIDAIRLLPFLGALGFMLPVLSMAGGTGSTMRGGAMLFVAWFALIGLTAYLVRRIEAADTAPESERDGA